MRTGIPGPTGLRARLLLLVGGAVTILLLGIFIAAMLAWRAIIVGELKQKALSVTRALSVSVLEDLITAEEGPVRGEDRLDNFIQHVMRQESGIRGVTVFDPGGRVISSSDLYELRYKAGPASPQSLEGVASVVSVIQEHPQFGWVVETIVPLRTGRKEWGFLQVYLDAAQTRREITALFWTLAAGTCVVVAGVLAVLFLIMSRATDSLSALAQALDRFDPSSPVALPLRVTPDELGTLVHHFNLLSDRLAHSRRELVQAQRQIHQAEKLASIGRLASGVAHEINNPLNGIKNCLYVIRQSPQDVPQTLQYLDLIGEGLDHIEMVVKKLLGFARQQPPRTVAVDLNEQVENVLSLLAYKLRDGRVEVRTSLEPDLPAVHGDPQLLQEVLMNLVLNSFDAVGEKGLVEVETSSKERAVRVRVADTGVGIPEHHLNRIFEPFFTTKDPGRGTGLGLAVALGIVEGHGGTISVTSAEGVGTAFTVELPKGAAA
jgi:signal transduction histidine kinase